MQQPKPVEPNPLDAETLAFAHRMVLKYGTTTQPTAPQRDKKRRARRKKSR